MAAGSSSVWDSFIKSLQCKVHQDHVYLPTPLINLKSNFNRVSDQVQGSGGCSRSVRNLRDVVLDPEAVRRLIETNGNFPVKNNSHKKKKKKNEVPNSEISKKKQLRDHVGNKENCLTTTVSMPPVIYKFGAGEYGHDHHEDEMINEKVAAGRVMIRSTTGGGKWPVLTELSDGNSSRSVVEIIFNTGWFGVAGGYHVERVFKVTNPPDRISAFETYRDAVKLRAGGNARCVTDGNEVLRFASAVPACRLDGVGSVCRLGRCPICRVADGSFCGGVRVAASTGAAHELAAGVGVKRGMLVCRVIAGSAAEDCKSRWRRRSSSKSPPPPPLSGSLKKGGGFGFGSPMRFDFGSVVAGGSGELLVLDLGAMLPCFLIVYRTMG